MVEQTSEASELIGSPGTQLRVNREQAKLSLAEVAEKLYVSKSKVQALESDEYESLPSQTFVQGYLRKYAILLDMDGDKLVSCYGQYLATMQRDDEEPTPVSNKKESLAVGARPPKWILPGVLLLGSILILSGVFYFVLNDTSRPDQRVVAPSSEIDLPESLRAIDDLSSTSLGLAGNDEFSADATSLENIENSAEENVVVLPRSELDEFQAEESVNNNDTFISESVIDEASQDLLLAEGIDELIIGFSDECWLEVSDISGRVIHANLHGVGEPVLIEGRAPFEIMLGNARAASISLNGETKIVPVAAGRRTAKFTIE